MTASALVLLVSLSAPPTTPADAALDERTVLAWVADLTAENGDKRRAAVEAFTRAGPKAKAAVPALIKMIDPKTGRGYEAVEILGLIGPAAKDAIPALKASLTDKRFEVRIEAALTLIVIDQKQAADTIPVLIEAMKSTDAQATRAARALAPFGPAAKDAVPELVKHFDAKSPHLRLFSAEAAARIDPTQSPKAVTVLVGLLQDKKFRSSMIRSYSLVSLQRIGPGAKEALPALVELLKDDGPFHADVARTMIAIDPAGAKPAYEWVRAILTDKNTDDDAYDLLERLPELGAAARPLVPELVTLLQSPTPFFRENAVLTLAAIGPDAKDALPDLKKLAANDPRKDIREAATEAVKKIEP